MKFNYKKKMDLNNQKLKIIHPPPNEESHPVTDPLGENSRNPAKKQEKSGLKRFTISIIIIITC